MGSHRLKVAGRRHASGNLPRVTRLFGDDWVCRLRPPVLLCVLSALCLARSAATEGFSPSGGLGRNGANQEEAGGVGQVDERDCRELHLADGKDPDRAARCEDLGDQHQEAGDFRVAATLYQNACFLSSPESAACEKSRAIERAPGYLKQMGDDCLGKVKLAPGVHRGNIENLFSASHCTYVAERYRDAGDLNGTLFFLEHACSFSSDAPSCRDAEVLRRQLGRAPATAGSTNAGVIYSGDHQSFRCQCPGGGPTSPWEVSSQAMAASQQALAAAAGGGSAESLLTSGLALLQSLTKGGVDPGDAAVCRNYARAGLCPAVVRAPPVAPTPSVAPPTSTSPTVGADWRPVVKPLTESESQRREREEFERKKVVAAKPTPQYKEVAGGSAETSRPPGYKDVTGGPGSPAALSYKDITVEDSGHRIASPTIDPRIRRTVHALFVGGTGVVEGFYVPTGATAAVRATEEQNLRQQLALRGLAPEAINAYLRDYRAFDMMIGLGADPSEPGDLIKRVVGLGTNNDQFSNGAFTAGNLPLYASLKGTKTTRLDCHSNGAMVCLAALSQGDVQAQEVRLFGPQVSAAALQQWQQLIAKKTVRSVEINLMYDDPIAPMSYRADRIRTELIVAGIFTGTTGALAVGALNAVAALVPPVEDVRAGIRENAPSIRVNLLNDPGCSERRWADLRHEFVACHDMSIYLKKAAKP